MNASLSPVAEFEEAAHLFTEPGALEAVAELADNRCGEQLGQVARQVDGSTP